MYILFWGENVIGNSNPIHTGRKLNVHKTLGRPLNVLRTFNLRPMSTGNNPEVAQPIPNTNIQSGNTFDLLNGWLSFALKLFVISIGSHLAALMGNLDNIIMNENDCWSWKRRICTTVTDSSMRFILLPICALWIMAVNLIINLQRFIAFAAFLDQFSKERFPQIYTINAKHFHFLTALIVSSAE